MKDIIGKTWNPSQIHLESVKFAEKPLVCFRRNQNLHDLLGQTRISSGKVLQKKELKAGRCSPCLRRSDTFEKETNGSISFLDVSVIRKLDGSFDTDIHRKSTDTNVYINWEAFAPKSWKKGTLKGLIWRAFTICSTKEFRDEEISHLKKGFGKQNGYPSRVIHDCIHAVQ